MGVSKTATINRAAMKLGVTAIADPSENTAQARIFSLLFETVARTELRKQAWSFAMARTILPAMSAAPSFGFTTQYQLPSDLLRLVYINDIYADPSYRDISASSDPLWQIENGVLLCSISAPLHIRYVSANVIPTPEKWDDTFTDAFACMLAFEASGNLTKNEKTAARVAQNYKAAIFEAKRANAIELPPQTRPDGSWMTARLW